MAQGLGVDGLSRVRRVEWWFAGAGPNWLISWQNLEFAKHRFAILYLQPKIVNKFKTIDYSEGTGVSDAVTLGWMLSAVVNGWGGRNLLEAYEAERLAIITKNRFQSAWNMAVRVMIQASTPVNARKAADYIQKIGNLENEAFGIEVDYRYDHSPAICLEASTALPWKVSAIIPSTRPGSRLPHFWLKPGKSVYDVLGKEFTLIRMADANTSAFEEETARLEIPLKIVDIRDASVARVYEKKLLLIRPDQHVVWRGNTVPENVREIWHRVTGRGSV